jgi:chaperonin GroES|tara:strand:+ start:274 stop:552 length:279 start_codon:yes stop_codon:yes gene_type:complete
MTEIKFTPLGTRVIIEPKEVETLTESGLIIPDGSRQQLPVGTVLAVGPGRNGETTTVKRGDIVLYRQGAGASTILEEGTFLMMSESEIYGIF